MIASSGFSNVYLQRQPTNWRDNANNHHSDWQNNTSETSNGSKITKYLK